MATVSLSPTTNPRASVVRHTATVLDMIRAAWARCKKPQTMLAKDLFRQRYKAVEHVLAVIIDIAQAPETTLDDVENIGLAICAVVRAEHAATHGWPVRMTRPEASIAEQIAQGERENAEKALDLDPNNRSKQLAFLTASAKYSCAARRLDEAVRRQVVEQSGAGLT